VASSRLTLESPLLLLFKKGIFETPDAYPVTLEHRQYQVCAATHILPDGKRCAAQMQLAQDQKVDLNGLYRYVR